MVAALGFGFYNFFVGKTTGKITPFVGTFFLSITAAAVALLITLFQKYAGARVEVTSEGVKFAVFAGLATGIAEIFYFFTFSKNPNVSVVLPLVFTVTVVTGVLLGVVFNREPITSIKLIGILLAIVSLYFLSR